MNRFVKKAQKHVPEPVLAAAGVQPGGTTKGLLGGVAALQGAAGGVIGTRLAQWRGRRTSGLRLTPYMLLAVTDFDMYLFEAGMTWGVRKPIAAWPRSEVSVTCEERTMTLCFEIRPSGSDAVVALEAPKKRGASDLRSLLTPR